MKTPLSIRVRAAAAWAAALVSLPRAASLVIVFAAPLALQAQVNVLTSRYDPQRTGANLRETALTIANVNPTQFGKLHSYPVDGSVYAQPLYVSGVVIGGRAHNVLYVATMNDKLYAFDADSSSPAPLWMRDFTSPPAVTPVPITDIAAPGLNIVGNIGIQSTPVIDGPSQRLYLLARSKENGAYVQRLHAVDIRTGQEHDGSPVTVEGSAPGTAPDATPGPGGTIITFDPKMQAQRAGLALANGIVLVAWAAHEDLVPSHGWIMGFDAVTLVRVGIFATAPDDYLAGIWEGGRAPAVDGQGYAYFATGNGKWDGVRNYGDSLLKIAAGPQGLSVADYFTPSNEAALKIDDDDLSGSGFTLLPGTNLLLGGGKEGVLYLLNKDNLGHQTPDDRQAQKISATGHVMGGPVYWRSLTQQFIYNWSEDDVLKAYEFTGSSIVTTPRAQGQIVSPGHPGGTLTVSSNGSIADSAIIWASMPTENAKHGLHAGILRAFNAITLEELWSSERNPARDRVGTLMKFVPPVVANGRVYLPNHDGAVDVYGLLTPDFTVATSPARQVAAPGTSVTYSVDVASVAAFSEAIDLAASGAPAGATVSFAPASLSGGGVSNMTVMVPANSPSAPYAISVSATSRTRAHFAAAVTLQVNAPLSGSGAIGVDFVGSALAMTPSERAGIVPIANWNSAAGASRTTPLTLVDELGAATTAAVTWTANNLWATPILDQPGDVRLMKGYLDTSSTSTTTVTVSGLEPRPYDVYVYVDGDNRAYERTAAYTITADAAAPVSAHLADLANSNFSGTFTAGVNGTGNYVKFRIAASAFTLTAAPTAPASGTRRAPVNAVEIVPAPVERAPAATAVNFVGSSALAMSATEAAGVIPATNWNNAYGAARTAPLALVDNAGAATGVTIIWTSNNTWALPITEEAGNRRMMTGYLDTSSTSTTTVTVSGLPLHTYDVYIYADGDNRTYDRTASYSLSGPGIVAASVTLTDRASTNFSGTFADAAGSAGNYVAFRITSTGFTLNATPLSGTNTTLRAPVNGIQIVPR